MNETRNQTFLDEGGPRPTTPRRSRSAFDFPLRSRSDAYFLSFSDALRLAARNDDHAVSCTHVMPDKYDIFYL